MNSQATPISLLHVLQSTEEVPATSVWGGESVGTKGLTNGVCLITKSVKQGVWFFVRRTKRHTTPASLLTPLELVLTQGGGHSKWRNDAAAEKRNCREEGTDIALCSAVVA